MYMCVYASYIYIWISTKSWKEGKRMVKQRCHAYQFHNHNDTQRDIHKSSHLLLRLSGCVFLDAGNRRWRLVGFHGQIRSWCRQCNKLMSGKSNRIYGLAIARRTNICAKSAITLENIYRNFHAILIQIYFIIWNTTNETDISINAPLKSFLQLIKNNLNISN